MELTVTLPGVTSASGCEVTLERWSGVGEPPTRVAPVTSSSSSSSPHHHAGHGDGVGDDPTLVEVGAWCIVVAATAEPRSMRLCVALPSDAVAIRDAGTERELDSIVVKFSRKHQRLTV